MIAGECVDRVVAPLNRISYVPAMPAMPQCRHRRAPSKEYNVLRPLIYSVCLDG